MCVIAECGLAVIRYHAEAGNERLADLADRDRHPDLLSLRGSASGANYHEGKVHSRFHFRSASILFIHITSVGNHNDNHVAFLIVNAIDHAPVTDTVTLITGPIALRSLDVIAKARVRLELPKTSRFVAKGRSAAAKNSSAVGDRMTSYIVPDLTPVDAFVLTQVAPCFFNLLWKCRVIQKRDIVGNGRKSLRG
jgi:hypothetical protein